MHVKTRTLSWPIGLTLLLLALARPGPAEDHVEKGVSPAASTPWRAPDLAAYSQVLRSGESSPIDPQKRYELPELVDLAERLNPETRVAWERARQAAIAVGLVQSEYSPILSLNPVHRIIGISGLIARISCERRTPVIPGIVRSVITKSNRPGDCEKSFNASKALVRASTS